MKMTLFAISLSAAISSLTASQALARSKSRYEAPMTTLLNKTSDVTGKAIIASLPATESVPDPSIEGEPQVEQLLNAKGFAWIEHAGLVRIVPKMDVTKAEKMLRETAADPWCKALTEETVNTDFPEPTNIKDIIKAMALWSGTSVIIPDSVQGKVRIVYDKKVSLQRACQFWLAALAQVGFKPAHSDDGLVVILSEGADSGWQWPTKKGVGKGYVDFAFDEQTDLAKIVNRYTELTGEKFTLEPEIKRQAAVILPRKVSATDLPKIFHATLQSVDLKAEQGVIRPISHVLKPKS